MTTILTAIFCMLYKAQSAKATKAASTVKYDCCYALMNMLQP